MTADSLLLFPPEYPEARVIPKSLFADFIKYFRVFGRFLVLSKICTL
jgi:hypothetical protein